MFSVSKKTLISGAIGNALEMYDYVLWGLFSIQLSKEFLPPHSKLSDIFFLFLITYILRPLGSSIGGILADKNGRKKVLTFSIILMGICTTVVGILPPYRSIGVISVFILLFTRLLQVLTAGSEYISSITLLIESCDKKQRGYIGSWVAFGLNSGVLLSSLIGALLLYLIDIKVLPEWGWRLAFIFSFITMLVGFWIRSSIPESLEFVIENARKEPRTFSDILNSALFAIRTQMYESFLVFFLVLFGTALTILIYVYAPLHMVNFTKIHNTQSFIINAFSLGVVIALIPLAGYLSDIFGRVKILSLSIITLSLFIFSYFHTISTGTVAQILTAHILIGIPCAAVFAIVPVLITEIFPLSIRCSATNLIYSLAACLGGGVTPLIALRFGTIYSPAWVVFFLGGISLTLLGIFLKRNQLGMEQFSLVQDL